MNYYPATERGMALVIVIWILTLMTLMAGSFAMSMRRESSISYAITSNADASAQAEGGIALAEFNLLQGDPEQRWKPNGSMHEVSLAADSRTRIRIFAESGKVDLNTASEIELTAVLKAAVYDDWQLQGLVNAIMDWRDADDDTRMRGAEKRQYHSAGLKYGPTNAAFQSLEDLQLVLGMTADIFEIIRPFITVYSGQSTVDRRYAAPQLLELLAAELKARNMHDQALESRLEAGDGGDAGTDANGQEFPSEGQTYTIIVETMVRQDASAAIETVVRYQRNDNGPPFETFDWKQNLLTASLFNPEMESQLVTTQDEFKYGDRY